jgi:hypothetical protein
MRQFHRYNADTKTKRPDEGNTDNMAASKANYDMIDQTKTRVLQILTMIGRYLINDFCSYWYMYYRKVDYCYNLIFLLQVRLRRGICA